MNRSFALVLIGISMWSVSAVAQTTATETPIYSFDGFTGSEPNGPLIQAADGNFYGTTQTGGAGGVSGEGGTIYRLTPSGVMTVLYTFTLPVYGNNYTSPTGYQPGPLIVGPDGDLYGIADGSISGGATGAIFKSDLAGNVTALYTFPAGYGPYGQLLLGPGGMMYGAAGGEPGGTGASIFKLNTSNGVVTTLYNFGTPQTGGGGQPNLPLTMDAVGNIYGSGIIDTGSPSYNGNIFLLTPSGTFNVIYTFTGASDGSVPQLNNGLITGNDGAFYGLSQAGSPGNNTELFRVTSSGQFSIVYNFPNSPDGVFLSPIQASDGNFYGVTQSRIYQLTPEGSFTPLFTYNFSDTEETGELIGSTLTIGSDGNFYGNSLQSSFTGTASGSLPWSGLDGDLFRVVPTPALSPTLQLSGVIEANQQVTLSWKVLNAISLSMQQCYASVGSGGGNTWSGLQSGTLNVSTGTYSGSATLTPVSGTYTYSLTCGGIVSGFATLSVGTAANPVPTPTTTVVEASASTVALNSANVSFVATVTPAPPAGEPVTFLLNGIAQSPVSVLSGGIATFATNLTLVGANTLTASYGGDANYAASSSTQISVNATNVVPALPAVTVSVLATIPPAPSGILGGPSQLIQASDGNLYGTLETGGTDGLGSVFDVSLGGTVNTLYSFGYSAPNGAIEPVSGVVEGPDGNFYGTTASSSTQFGTLFQMTPAGVPTILHAFDGNAGSATPTSLLLASDGNLYGTTSGSSAGIAEPPLTLFSSTLGGQFSTLYTISNAVGAPPYPAPGLIQGADGNLYGNEAGAGGGDLIFSASTSGQLSPLYTFTSGWDGTAPNPITLGPDGNYYGVTTTGIFGSESGYAFKLTPGGSTNLAPGQSINPNPAGRMTILHAFQSPNYLTLLAATDGNLYGIEPPDGSSSDLYGALFRITPNGAFSILYSFPNQTLTDGSESLIQASDGNLYGIGRGSSPGYSILKIALSPALPPPVQITLSSSNIGLGQTVTLNWSVANALSPALQNCFATGQTGAGSWSGTQIGTLNGSVYSGSSPITPTATGTYTYALTCGGGESAFATLAVSPAAAPIATNITASAGTPQSAATGAVYAIPLAATVTDQFSNPFPGAMVTFTAPTGVGAGGTFATPATAITGSNGVATAPAFTANSTPGSYQVTASTAGIAGSAMFSLTNTAPLTATPVIAPSAGSYGSQQPVTITDATPGAVIFYTTNGSTPAAGSTVYSGAISVTSSETIQAVAQAPGDSLSAVASASYTITQPAQLSLTPGTISTRVKSTASNSVLSAVAFDSAGNSYVLDSGLGTITRYSPTGMNPATIVSGTTFSNPSDMAIGSDGATLYVSDYGNNRIVAVNTSVSPAAVTPLSIQNLPTPATLNAPAGIAVGGPSGNLFISDTGNGRVLQLSTTGQFVSTVASAGGSPSLIAALGVAVDPAGNVYIANSNPQGAGNILKASGGSINAISNANIVSPYGLATDAAGDVYYSDQNLRIIGKVDPSEAVSLIAGNAMASVDSGDGGPATAAGLLSPLGVALDASNNVYIADSPLTGTGGSVRSISVGTGALVFATQASGVTSTPQMLTVSNTGGATLTVNSLGNLSGANPNDFSIAGGSNNGCTSSAVFSLGPGVSCALAVTFTPTTTGAESATLTFVDNATTIAQTATFTGTGTAPVVATKTTLIGPGSGSYGGFTGSDGVFVITVKDATGLVVTTGTVAYTVTTGSTTVASGGGPVSALSSTEIVIGLWAPGSYVIVASYTPASGLNLAASQATATLVISPQITTTTLASSNISASVGSSITFTAAVNDTVAGPGIGALAPTGAVTFRDGSNVLGTATASSSNMSTINPGIATFTTNSLTQGTHSITAAYAGDNVGYLASTSPAVVETITAPGYSIVVTPGSLTIGQGQTGTATFTVTSVGGYSQPVAFACGAGLPANTVCSFNPPSVTPTATGATTILTVTTDQAGSLRSRPEPPGRPATLIELAGTSLGGLFLLLGCRSHKWTRRLRLSRHTPLMVLALTFALGFSILGCGSHPSTLPTTPVGTDTVTITATSGSGALAVNQTITLQITFTH